MIPIIGFVGEKKSGKTLMLEAVIRVLSKKGRKIGVIKHTRHGFKLDYPETDSSRLMNSGARKVLMLGNGQIGVYGAESPEPSVEQARDLYFPELDLVLVEGYKDAAVPKVLVALSGKVPAWGKNLPGLIAVVAPKKTALKASQFKPSQAAQLAGLVDGYVKLHRGKREVNIYLDGEKLQIKPFIKDFFLNSINGMIGSLSGAKGAKRIQISIEIPEGVSVPIPGE